MSEISISIQEVYPAPHQILIFHDVLSTKESDELMEVSKPLMKTSQIGEYSFQTLSYIVKKPFELKVDNFQLIFY